MGGGHSRATLHARAYKSHGDHRGHRVDQTRQRRRSARQRQMVRRRALMGSSPDDAQMQQVEPIEPVGRAFRSRAPFADAPPPSGAGYGFRPMPTGMWIGANDAAPRTDAQAFALYQSYKPMIAARRREREVAAADQRQLMRALMSDPRYARGVASLPDRQLLDGRPTDEWSPADHEFMARLADDPRYADVYYRILTHNCAYHITREAIVKEGRFAPV
jgi:hypothetical protein